MENHLAQFACLGRHHSDLRSSATRRPPPWEQKVEASRNSSFGRRAWTWLSRRMHSLQWKLYVTQKSLNIDYKRLAPPDIDTRVKTLGFLAKWMRLLQHPYWVELRKEVSPLATLSSTLVSCVRLCKVAQSCHSHLILYTFGIFRATGELCKTLQHRSKLTELRGWFPKDVVDVYVASEDD